MLPCAPTVDWTLTQYETALVRVHLHALGATSASAELTLSTRCRHRRFTELPRPAAPDAGESPPDIAAAFEVPVAMLYRKGLRARITVGPIESALDWSELASTGPRPAAEFAALGDLVQREAPKRRPVLLHAAPAPASPPRRATPPVPASARAMARAAAHGRPPARTVPMPRVLGPAAARAVAHSGPPAPTVPMPRALGPAAADGSPPIAIDRTLMQFLPYEEAAPLLAMPVSLAGDVLTVAVALPSVDLSFITDRSPWLRIEREVTGYHRIVQALREVESMHDQRASSPAGDATTIRGLDEPAASRRQVDVVRPQPAEPSAGATAASRRSLRHATRARRLRAMVAGVRTRSEAREHQRGFAGAVARLARDRQRREHQRGFAGALARLARDRQRREHQRGFAGAIARLAREPLHQAAVAAVAGVGATAVLIATASTPAGTADVAARAALDTTACTGALVAAYLAVACYRRRSSAASLAVALALGILAFTTAVIAQIAVPLPSRRGGLGEAFTAASSSVVLQTLGVVALAGGALWLAARSRRSHDELLGWCSIGAVSLAIAHVNALLAPPAGGWVSAEDVFRLAAVASFLIGVAREITAHGRQLASAAVAAERRRMARELHDGVAQELAFIVSQASSLARHERPPGPLQSIALAGERALIDSRRSIHRLTRPDASTLHEALTEQASQWARRAGLELEVQMPADVHTSPEMQHAILRIVQEAISNAVRHAGATRVMVSLSERDGSVTVRISDDGRGFDPHPASPEQPERGFGLVSMAERAEAFGGQLRLESEPGRGTVVEVAFR